MSTGNPTPDDFERQPVVEAPAGNPPELTIDGIKKQTEDLRKRVAAAKLAQKADIEKKVEEHDAMRAQLPGLIELLQTAQETRDYYISVKEAGELPQGDEPRLIEIETTIADLQSQITTMEARINFFGSQPDILNHIHEIALTMRDGEKKGEIMSQGIENLTMENGVIAEEVKNLALEFQKIITEREAIEKRLRELIGKIEEFLDVAMKGLESGKHRNTYELLNGHHGVPTVEQLQKRRKELGVLGSGKEKAAIDIMLQQKDSLEEYQRLKDADKVLEEKVFGKAKETKIAQLRRRIEEHMIKAWELHDQTGIPKNGLKVDAPTKVFMDLQDQIDFLGGTQTVERKKDGRQTRVSEVVNDTPGKKAIRDFWDSVNYFNSGERMGERLSYCTFRRPTLESN